MSGAGVARFTGECGVLSHRPCVRPSFDDDHLVQQQLGHADFQGAGRVGILELPVLPQLLDPGRGMLRLEPDGDGEGRQDFLAQPFDGRSGAEPRRTETCQLEVSQMLSTMGDYDRGVRDPRYSNPSKRGF